MILLISSRAAFRDELLALAKNDKRLIDIEADLGGQTNQFKAEIPDRYFNMGIAESASLDICTGLAKNGLKPVFSTFAPFVALRAAEHVKLSLAYMHENIIIGSCYGGASGGWFGTTHQSLEDLAIIRALPGIKVACPYGEKETRLTLDHAVASNDPWYIRLGRNNSYSDILNVSEFTPYQWYQPLSTETKVCVVSSGEVATDFCTQVAQEKKVAHLHILESDITSLNKMRLVLEKIKVPIIAVEEHRQFGSLGTVLKTLNLKSEIISYNVNDKWPIYGGSHYEVLDYLDFSISDLKKQVSKFLKG